MADASTERMALDKMEPIWSSQGYTLVRNPMREQVPSFLGNYLPDAIATGKEPGLIIEVINPRMPSTRTKVSQLQKLMAEHPGWRLEIIYTLSDATDITRAPQPEIDSALTEAEKLAHSEPRAALLLAWAGLEALGRALHPELADRGLSSNSLIDLLISQGNIKQSLHNELRELGRMRNRIAHGQLDLSPTPQNVLRLIELARSLSEPA